MMWRRTCIAASLGSAARVAGVCVPATVRNHAHLHSGGALAFGTSISVAVVHENAHQARLAIEDALHAAQRIDRLMSIYSADSEVFRLNRDGVLARPDPLLLAVLQQARELSVLTRGAFDITVQPLWRAYRRAEKAASLPLPHERILAGARVDWQNVEFGPERVALLKPGMAITLNGLAQGYAADLALAAVRTRGIAHALLDTGELIASGRRAARRPWTLGIEHPRASATLAATVRIDGRSVATSGDYRSAFTADFVHHHILDPATGASPQELASVTVLAPSAMQADGLSTAFMVMGARKAHALAAQLPQVDLMTINKRGVVWKSSGFPSAA